MSTSDQMKGNMAEATRLTQQGRLDEATAAIQRALGGGSGTAMRPANFGRSGGPIDVTSKIVREAPGGPVAGGGRPFRRPEAAARTKPRPNPFTPGASGSAGAAGKAAFVDAPEGARFLERSYTNSAGTRSYKLYIPSGYSGQAVPLVVMLHGCTQDPDDFATGTRMNGLAEEHTFLVAYPAQAGNANMQKCWNWFQASDQERGRGEPSLIAGITQQVMEEYEVVEGRVYVAGMSAGGAMAAILGATYPDLYAAVGVHSGLAPGSAHDMSSAFTAMRQGNHGAARKGDRAGGRSVPTVVFHGDKDSTVHPRNGENVLSRLTVDGGSSLEVSTRQGSVPGGHSFTRTSYKGSDGRPVVERWSVHGLGHAWSGGSYPGSYTDPRGPDASGEMVRFFLQHEMP